MPLRTAPAESRVHLEQPSPQRRAHETFTPGRASVLASLDHPSSTPAWTSVERETSPLRGSSKRSRIWAFQSAEPRGNMQNFTTIVNELLSWENDNPHRHDCFDPPHALRVGFHHGKSPPRRWDEIAKPAPWKARPTRVGFRGGRASEAKIALGCSVRSLSEQPRRELNVSEQPTSGFPPSRKGLGCPGYLL
jgi:hypothetical protein